MTEQASDAGAEPYPLEPAGAADVRPEDGPQDFELADPDDQARQVDEMIEKGEG